MIDLPPTLPVDYSEQVCIERAAKHQGVDPRLLWAVRLVEGGRKGLVRKNSNNSYDVGIMQINTINFNRVKQFGIDPSWLLHTNCGSIFAAAHILRKEIDRAGPGQFWVGVGSYNSRTPKHNKVYREKVMKTLEEFDWSAEKMAQEAYKRHQKPYEELSVYEGQQVAYLDQSFVTTERQKIKISIPAYRVDLSDSQIDDKVENLIKSASDHLISKGLLLKSVAQPNPSVGLSHGGR